MLELNPDNIQWQQERRKRLKECAQSRFVFARRALSRFEPDYEAALRHYEAVVEIEETSYPGLAQELNLDLDEKTAELRTKVNYDGKNIEILKLIEDEAYVAA